jgi:hypothetical protein
MNALTAVCIVPFASLTIAMALYLVTLNPFWKRSK